MCIRDRATTEMLRPTDVNRMASLKVRPVKPQIRMAKMKNIRIKMCIRDRCVPEPVLPVIRC